MGGIMSIVLQGSTSGSVTLQEPAVAGTTVLTLPAVSGNVLTDTSPKAGNVLQVVSASTQSSTSTTSTSFVTTGFSVSITPTSSSSKILVMLAGGNFDSNSTSNAGICATFYRNSTNLGGVEGIYTLRSVTARLLAGGSLLIYDTPSTTSATTYTLYIKSEAGQNVSFNNSGGLLSTLIAMEIAG
jgi:hypothetical protein